MPWLCFLLGSAATVQATPLRFDVAALTAQRDSFVFSINGELRGSAVWRYEVRGTDLVFTAVSEFRPVEAESLRVVIDRASGAPLASYHRVEFGHPESDTLFLEHDLQIRGGAVTGSRRVARRRTPVSTRPAHAALPAGTVLSDYGLFAAAVTNLSPGDSGATRAYSEFGDSLLTLSLVAEPVRTITVPAGRFEVLPLRSEGFRLYVTRVAPRRVVRGESMDGAFKFELVRP